MSTDRPPACVIVDPKQIEPRIGSGYPAPYAGPCAQRIKRALGNAVGLKTFGVNLTELPPGAWSAQRHWHTHQDEFIYVLEGELVLVTDTGEFTLKPGMSAGFPGGAQDGHHLINRTERPALYLEIGDRPAAEEVFYPEADLALRPHEGKSRFTRRDGTPY